MKQYVSPALHPDGRLLAVSMETGVGLWDLLSERELGHLAIDRVQSVHFDSSGALWTNGLAGVLRWPTRRGSGNADSLEVGPPEVISDSPSFGVDMAISTDGAVAAASGGNSPTWVSRRDRPGQPIAIRHDSDVRHVAVSPDGRWVATLGQSPPHVGVKVWDSMTGKMATHLFPEIRFWGLAFSPDGQFLIVGGYWFEVGTWRQTKTVDGWHAAYSTISPDGRYLAIWEGPSEGQGIRLFDGTTGRSLVRLGSPDQGRVYSMIFSPDGTRLIGVDVDNAVVQVWNLRKLREELRALDLDWDALPFPPAPPEEHERGEPRSVRINLGDIEDDVVLGWQPSREHLQSIVGLNTLSLALQPVNSPAHRQRGRALAMLGQPKLALDDYSTALALMPPGDPSRADLLGRRARVYLNLKEPEKAVADLEESERLDPARGKSIRRSLALVLVRRASRARKQDAAAAIRDLRQAVAIDPLSETAHNTLAWFLVTAPEEYRDANDGLLHARRAVELSHGDPSHLNTLGMAQYRNGLFRDAIDTLEKSLAASGREGAGYDLYGLAPAHAGLGEAGRARERFDEAVKWHDAKRGNLSSVEDDELEAFRAEAALALKRLN